MLSLFSFSNVDLDGVGFQIPYADKLTHFVFYMVFGFLGSLFVRERTRGAVNIQKATKIMVVSAIAYGMLVEVLQYAFTTDRMAEWADVVANSLGAFAGIGLIRWIFSKEKPLKWKF
ncbi:MAG: VanZ family protein [Muricauda sp.]|nr:VanZ family protein [Allomuricauda sp.]